MNWPIATMQIESEADVVAVRQRARHLAELLGFERRDQTRIATAVSEIARNAFSFAKNGRAEFAVDDTQKRPIFNIRISDSGKGIADLNAALEGRPGSAEGTGRGMMGAKRLVDRFEAKSESGKGTIIDLGQILPPKAGKLSRAKIAEIARALQPVRSEDPMAIMREQNRELMQSLEELRQRRSENEQLSHELADTNRGVVALYAELEGQADKLKRASELKTRFLSNMSHEFRTPLNSILALSRLLLDRIDGPLSTEQQKQVTYIRRSAEGLLELVNDLLDMAKVEAGKIDIRPSAFTVEGLFGALRGALKPLLTNAEVELTFDSAPDVPELFTDEQKVSQVLRNLVSNALKFTEEGEVTVAAAYDDGRVTFSVRDTGIGIAREDQKRIFEEFSQLDSRLQTSVKGTGLGLSLSRDLARLLGGEITVESVLGQGSVFRLIIPARLGQEALDATTAPPRSRKRVLVIDDDETFHYLVRQFIGTGLYDVIAAANGRIGLKRARNDRPDFIFLDLQMPDMDGFTVLSELAADPALRSIPVVIWTALRITPELKARLPAGINIVSKTDMSAETLASVLHDVVSPLPLRERS